ncbi:MAG: Calx-beta domain-containing protein, partial [Oscillatoria sp. PMC 1076.18]|nr:Calx-beta domain-containing protein [Oscillatoria sp. PMC 1076.18]
ALEISENTSLTSKKYGWSENEPLLNKINNTQKQEIFSSNESQDSKIELVDEEPNKISNNINLLNQNFGWLEDGQQNFHSAERRLVTCDCIACHGGISNSSLEPQAMPIPQESYVSSSGDYQIDALLGGSKWDSTTITYSFYSNANGGAYYGSETVWEVSEAVKNNVRTILEDVLEPLINVNFVEVADTANSYGQLRYMFSDGPDYAYASYPEWPWNPEEAGDVHLSPNYENDWWNNFSDGPGNHGYETLIHETGHALGLKHPGNYNGSGSGTGPFLPYWEDHNTNTLMSYNTPGSSAVTPMAYDIKALQYLYGAKAHNQGATTYDFQSVDLYSVDGVDSHTSSLDVKQTIWDSGGIDVFDFSGLNFNNNGYYFDLTEGGMLTTQSAYNSSPYSARSDASGSTYYTTGFGTAIAFDTVIENLINSTSNDYIIANSAANTFSGYAPGLFTGNDEIFGWDNLDILDLSSYDSSRVSQTRSGNNLILGLDSYGEITLGDYYTVSASDRLSILFNQTNPTDDNYEENDTRTTAYNLSANERTWLSNLDGLGIASDEDWYKIDITPGYENLVVDLQFAHADGDIDLKVYDANGNFVAGSYSITDNESIDTILPSSGTYYLKVYPYSGSGNTYDLWWDDIRASVPQLSIDNVTITESDGGINNAVFTVNLDTASSNTVTVNYYTTDDTAISGSDYSYTSGTLTFNPGQTTATISIPIVDDAVVEADESFFVNLYNASNANIADSQGIGTILNDDLDSLIINGTSGNDKLKGTAEDETINGFEGNDNIKGNDGNDTLNGGEGNDKLDAGNGDDYVDGGAGKDNLKGVNGNNTLVGGTGNDKITGGKGIDILIGVDPNSSIAGRGEVDTIKGSKSADVFVLGNEFGAFYNDGNNSNAGESDYALIKDFKLSDGDVIQLAGSASNYVLGAAGKHTEIFLETGGVDELIAIVQKVNPTDLDLNSSSFNFV